MHEAGSASRRTGQIAARRDGGRTEGKVALLLGLPLLLQLHAPRVNELVDGRPRPGLATRGRRCPPRWQTTTPVLASLGASILPQLRLAFTAFPCLKVTLGWICSFTSCVAGSAPRVRVCVARGHEPLSGPVRDREYDAVTHPVGVKLATGTPASPRPAARGRARSRPQSARPRHVPARPRTTPARARTTPAHARTTAAKRSPRRRSKETFPRRKALGTAKAA